MASYRDNGGAVEALDIVRNALHSNKSAPPTKEAVEAVGVDRRDVGRTIGGTTPTRGRVARCPVL